MADPLTIGMLGLGALQGGANAIWGQQADQTQGSYNVNPYQQALAHQTQLAALKGNLGDTGYGTAVKQGKSQLQNFLARQGIAQGSGVGIAGMGNMLANASSQDAQNRHNRLMDISRIQTQWGGGGSGDHMRGQIFEQGIPYGRQPNSFFAPRPAPMAPADVVSGVGRGRQGTAWNQFGG